MAIEWYFLLGALSDTMRRFETVQLLLIASGWPTLHLECIVQDQRF